MKRFVIVFLFLAFFPSVYPQITSGNFKLPTLEYRKLNTSNGLSSDNINCILQDEKGFVWIGTNGGVNKFDGNKVENLSESEELSSFLFSDICEDVNGHLWLATKDVGLFRYDPNADRYFQYIHVEADSSSLASNYIYSIRASASGYLWVSTTSGIQYAKIPELTVGDDNFEQLRFSGIDQLNERIFGRVCPYGEDQCIAVSTIHGFINLELESDASKEKVNVREVFNERINSVRIDNEKRIWTNGKHSFDMTVFDSVDRSFHTTKFDICLHGEGVNIDEIYTFVFDLDGKIWIGTSENGLYSGKVNFENQRIDLESHSWFNQLDPNGISSNMIRTLMVDRSNVLWVGTEGGGINMLDLEKKPFRLLNNFSDKMNSLIVKSVYEDVDENLWIGIDGNSLFFVPSTAGEAIRYVDFKDSLINDVARSVNTIFQTKDGIMWVGTEGRGLFSFYSEDFQYRIHSSPPYNNGLMSGASATSMVEDEHGNLWIGTYGGGLNYAWRGKNGQIDSCKVFKHSVDDEYSLPDDIVRSLFLQDEMLYIGTGQGLRVLSREGNTFLPLMTESGEYCLQNEYILPILRATNGDIWVGTLGDGLFKLALVKGEEGYLLTSITVKDGLLDNVVKSLVEDENGNIWVATNNGLCFIDEEDGGIVNYKSGVVQNALSFNEMSVAKRRNGEFVFGSVNGLLSFDPNEIEHKDYHPDLTFTGLKILDEEIRVGEELNGRVVLSEAISELKEITLLHREQIVEFEFALLQYSLQLPDLRFRLKGFNDDWTKLTDGERTVKYTSLPHGRYVLEVEAMGFDQGGENAIISLGVRVKPPFWLSIPAFIMYLLLVGFAVYFVSRYSIIQNNKKNELLIKGIKKEKAEELSRMKLDFFTKISHEFRTPLTIIVGTIEKLFAGDEGQSRNYRMIRRNVNTLLRLVNQLSSFQKYEAGVLNLNVSCNNLVDFGRSVFESFEPLANNKSLKYSFESNEQEIKLWFDTDKMEKVFFNLISNAIKYTPKEGSVQVWILNQADYVEVVFEDNGVGIAEDQQEHIFDLYFRADKNDRLGTGIGLAFSKSLVDMHSGKLFFESAKGKGSTFHLILKKGKAHFEEGDFSVEGIGYEAIENLSSSTEWKQPVPVADDETGVEVDRSSFPVVLVVEDELEVRKFIAKNLEDQFRVIEASNGREGLEKCRENMPDLVLSDVMMPEMDGFELCKAVKSDEKTGHIPFIMLTARANEEDKRMGFEFEVDEYILKPFNISHLILRINSLIKLRKKLLKKTTTQLSLEPENVTISKADEHFLKRAKQLMEKHISDAEYGVAEFSSDMGLSAPHLNTKMKKLLDMTSIKFMRTVRMKRAAQLLKLGTSVSDVALECGYNSVRRFRESFKEFYGVAPSEYKD